MEYPVRYAAWTQVIDNCTINEYPETLVEVGKKLYEQQVETYAKYAGMELDAYIESSGLTQEEYQSNMEEYGKNVAAQALVCQAICDKEGFAIKTNWNPAAPWHIRWNTCHRRSRDLEMWTGENMYQH